MAGIISADYWLIKKQHVDIPALYNPHGRYRYIVGCNWRAAIAFIVPVAPLLPGLALSISGAKKIHISEGTQHLYTFNWLFGFVTAIILYTVLSLAFPAKKTILTDTVWSLDGTIEGQGSDEEMGRESAHGSGSGEPEKLVHESDSKPL